MSPERSVTYVSGTDKNKLVGERGFEPPTPGPELGGVELTLLIFNHLSGASTVSVLLNHASLGVM